MRRHMHSETQVPLFVLERLAHIRCYCLTVRAAGGGARQLVGAAVEVHETVVAVSCRFAGQEVSCCLQLDLGEELEGRSGTMACQVADGYAYARLPLAPPPADGPAELRVAASEEMRLREEAGEYRRAAEMRRRERAALQGAWLRCVHYN